MRFWLFIFTILWLCLQVRLKFLPDALGFQLEKDYFYLFLYRTKCWPTDWVWFPSEQIPNFSFGRPRKIQRQLTKVRSRAEIHQVQWRSEYWSSQVLKWSKIVQSLNGPLFACHLNTGLNFLRYSDHNLNSGPVFEWWSENLITISIPEILIFTVDDCTTVCTGPN